jgi:hypothetical protein
MTDLKQAIEEALISENERGYPVIIFGSDDSPKHILEAARKYAAIMEATDARKQEALDAFEWLFTNYVPKDAPLVATGYCNMVRAALRADAVQTKCTCDMTMTEMFGCIDPDCYGCDKCRIPLNPQQQKGE